MMAVGYRLSTQQIESFHTNGYIGPFPLHVSSAEIDAARKAATDGYLTPNPIYDFVIGRDLHLFSKPLYELFNRDEIKAKVTQLLGDELTMWRSDVFPKPPGAPATVWHQADVFTEFTEL